MGDLFRQRARVCTFVPYVMHIIFGDESLLCTLSILPWPVMSLLLRSTIDFPVEALPTAVRNKLNAITTTCCTSDFALICELFKLRRNKT